MGRYKTPPKYLPTQKEIRKVCAEIQAGWSPEEEERRRAYKTEDFTGWRVPKLVCRGLKEAIPELYVSVPR